MPLSLLLALLSWSPVAFAADGGGNAERTVQTQADVRSFVDEVRAAAGGPVLLAAAGPDAERLALRVAEAMPPGAVRVQRVGYGPEEVARALSAAGMGCAVRLGATPTGAWTVAQAGTCAPRTAAPPPESAAPTAPAPSVSTIPGLGAALATSGPPAPPAPAPAPVLQPLAPPPPPDPAVLQSTYDAVALRRVENPKPRPELPEAVWAVRDGRGRTLDALDFARRTGDLSVERKLERENKLARGLGIGLAVGGGALAVAGLGVLVGRDAGAPRWSEYEPDLASYDTNAQYYEALAQAEADFRAAEDEHAIRRDDRVWIAGFLTGAGVLALGAAPFAARGAADRRTLPALYWEPDRADALIEAHNQAVKQRIGIADPAPAKAVIITPPPPPEEEEEEHEDPPEDAPRPLPPADPGGPSGRHDLHLTPVFGFAWTGIVGTF